MIDKKAFYESFCLPRKLVKYEIDDVELYPCQENKDNLNKFKSYHKNMKKNLIDGYGCILCGPVGVGKTTLATILVKKAFDIYLEIWKEYGFRKPSTWTCRYIQATSIYFLTNRFGLSDKELELRRNLKEIPILLIDDLTKFGETNRGNELLFLDDIVRYRDLNGLITFYTVQTHFDELSKLLTKPIHDMIKGNCEILMFIGESFR